METVLITGGTGLVGKAISTHLLSRGYGVTVLTRQLPKDRPQQNLGYALWNVKAQTIDVDAVQKADHIIHLAGAGVADKKWTAAYKKEIEESRTKSSKLLIETLQKNSNKVKTVVSASAIGWYGEDTAGRKAFIETDEAGTEFLGKICQLWEQSITPVEALQKRLVVLRTGIALSNDGGALAEIKRPVKIGIAGILNGGKQVVSWIHIDDLCRLYINAIENEQLSGVYNAVAPAPVTNQQLTIELAQQLKKRFFIPMHVPSFVLKVMLGERSIEILKSTTVSCAKIEKTGFTFLYPTIASALQQLCYKPS